MKPEVKIITPVVNVKSMLDLKKGTVIAEIDDPESDIHGYINVDDDYEDTDCFDIVMESKDMKTYELYVYNTAENVCGMTAADIETYLVKMLGVAKKMKEHGWCLDNGDVYDRNNNYVMTGMEIAA